MAYSHRILSGDKFYRMRNYCCEGQAFFRHSPETHQIITNLMCKYAATRNIQFAGYVFMPEYFEMIFRAPEVNHDDFMQDFQGQVARVLGEHWGRSGPFFVGRYEGSEIGAEALVDAYLEMMCLPVSENYVDHPAKWPGVTSWEGTLSGEPLVGARQNREEYWKLRRRKSNDNKTDVELEAMATEYYEVELAKLPDWEALDDIAYAQKVEERVADKVMLIRAFCGGNNLTGVDIIPAHPCDARPGVMCRRMPLYTCRSAGAQMVCRAKRKAAVKQYRRAAKRLRRGWKKAYFPAGMFPPGHLHAVGSPGALGAGEARGAPGPEKAQGSGDAVGT